ncbi:MAG: O-antigen ligase family protein [bacterium]
MELGLGLTKIIPFLLYLIMILVAVLTLIYRVEIGIYFLVPLIPQQSTLEGIARYPLGKDIVDVILLSLLLRWWVDSSRKPGGMFAKTPINTPVFWLALWTFFELWLGSFNLNLPLPISISDARFVTWKNFMILPLLYFVVVNNVEDKKQIKIILGLMALSMLFMDRHFYNNFRGRSVEGYSHDLRSSGTFSYLGPNELAAFYAQYTLPILCVMLLDRQILVRVFAGVVMSFNYYCMVYLFSRGGYLATLVGWSFLGLVRDRRVLVVLALLLIFWRFLLPNAVVERIEMTQTEAGTDTSVQERVQMWDMAIDVIESNPLLGIGYNTTPYFGFTESITGQHRNNLHNGYIEVLTELGAIGLLIYLIIFLKGMAAGWRLYKIAPEPFFKALGLGFVAGILASLAANITGNNWHYFNVAGFFWVTFALVVRCLKIIDSESGAEAQAQPGHDEKQVFVWKSARPSWTPSHV